MNIYWLWLSSDPDMVGAKGKAVSWTYACSVHKQHWRDRQSTKASRHAYTLIHIYICKYTALLLCTPYRCLHMSECSSTITTSSIAQQRCRCVRERVLERSHLRADGARSVTHGDEQRRTDCRAAQSSHLFTRQENVPWTTPYLLCPWTSANCLSLPRTRCHGAISLQLPQLSLLFSSRPFLWQFRSEMTRTIETSMGTPVARSATRTTTVGGGTFTAPRRCLRRQQSCIGHQRRAAKAD